MHCQTVIKSKGRFHGFVGVLSNTSRTYPEAIRKKNRLSIWQKGKFTKHYFEGSSRIVSKLGEGTFQQPSGLTAGGIDYIKQSAKQQEALDNYIRNLNVPPGPPTQQGIYASPEWTGKDYPSISWSDISQDQEPPEGWPRPPKFNEPGDVPGPPVQFGDPVKPETVEGGFGFKDNGIEEHNLYYYHPDHLGSSSYITDANGRINQHTEYIAFGEILFDEHRTDRTMPYLFNGKELDSETGLYYYGARYYDPKVSLWLNVDPLMIRDEVFDDENSTNGGVFNPMNNSVYSFSYQNPIRYIDPDGECPNCITAAAGAVVGAIIGGGLEAGMQLYENGKITDWKAVGGSALQGGITGGAAGFTGGASLAVTAGASAGANVVGGIANRAVQGKSTTTGDVVMDASLGAVFGAGGKYINVLKSSSIIRNRSAFLNSVFKPSKNGMTSVGRALQKHAGRAGSTFEDITFSGKTATKDGIKVINEIIRSKNSLIDLEKNGTKTIYDKTTGRGFNINRQGHFGGFRELPKRDINNIKKVIKE
ncbi:hypothetical protein MWN41_09525 [Ornithobacterium rhinotracheale]|uniref:RHS repeat-associated core domain-containing protein n=1 Tax=Ornithobacterium rhinotracheale TaxID=28251 RepID=UPI001FF3CFCD|nr:RHS repeat-associated core domain-containing protein [Ornithobacterium rhinotracheale]MCK0203251.1 hypothetical protein [Ornithobacterium rhinotracheale]